MVLFFDLDKLPEIYDFSGSWIVDDFNIEYFTTMGRLCNLLNLPFDKLDLIDEIIFVNSSSGQSKEWYSSIIEDFSKEIKRRKQSPKIVQLLRKGSYSIFTSFDEAILKLLVEDIIFFDIFLTRGSYPYLLASQQIVGYRSKLNNGILEWEPILDIYKYILISETLVRIDFAEEYGDRIFEPTKRYKIPIINIAGCNKYRFRFLDQTEKNYLDFISKIQDLAGPLFVVDCKNKSFVLPQQVQNLLILNVDQLSTAQKSELQYAILNKKYKDNLVIIVDSDPETIIGYPQFNDFVIYPFINDKSLNLYHIRFQHIEFIKNEMTKILTNLRKIINFIVSDVRIKNKIFNRLKMLNKMSGCYNIDLVNFWYDLEFFQMENIKTVIQNFKKNFVENYSRYKNEKDKVFYLIHNKVDEDEWIIKKDEKEIKRIKYNQSKGINYLAYLGKHYKHKKISVTKLKETIDKWRGKTYKPTKMMKDYSAVNSALHHLFKTQCEELISLKVCIKINYKEPGCHFQPKNNINIEVVDEDMPGPVI